MNHPKLGFVVAVAACGALVSFCGTPDEPAAKDAGVASTDAATECWRSDDCFLGDCVAGRCRSCDELPCLQGQTCGERGKCVTCDGGSCGGARDGGSSCTSKADCPAGKACRSGACAAEASPCAASDQCAAGRYCEQSSCRTGCESGADCAGATAGPRCNTTAHTCGCQAQGDCRTGLNCMNGVCQPAATCASRASCGDLACLNGTCAPCAGNADCGAPASGLVCTLGRCVPSSAGCTSDAECKVNGAGYWCNPQTHGCEWGCVAGHADAGEGNDYLCPAAQECDPVTHACSAPPCNHCGGCADGLQCNEAICQCEEVPRDAGGLYEKCDQYCGCPTGMHCDCGSKLGLPIDCNTMPQICMSGFLPCVPD